MTRSVAVPLDEDVVVRVEPGEDDWAYRVTVVRDGGTVTSYGSDFEPWGRAGRTMLGNILATRLDGFGSKEHVASILDAAFAERADAFEALESA